MLQDKPYTPQPEERIGLVHVFEIGRLLVPTDIDYPDGDWMKTWEEYRAGTDPTNAASVFRLQEIAPVADGIRLTWSGTTNSGVTTPFLMYCATNLFSPGWELISGGIPRAGNGLNVWTDAVPASGTPVFYRVAVPAR